MREDNTIEFEVFTVENLATLKGILKANFRLVLSAGKVEMGATSNTQVQNLGSKPTENFSGAAAGYASLWGAWLVAYGGSSGSTCMH